MEILRILVTFSLFFFSFVVVVDLFDTPFKKKKRKKNGDRIEGYVLPLLKYIKSTDIAFIFISLINCSLLPSLCFKKGLVAVTLENRNVEK